MNAPRNEEILINVTPQETRVAIVDNGMLQEVHIERKDAKGIVGNIYKGKVVRVLPGMQAAFVEIGLERTAFLHARDARPMLIMGDSDDEDNDSDNESTERPINELLPKLRRWTNRAIELNADDYLAHYLAADLAFHAGDCEATAQHLGHAIESGLEVESATKFLQAARTKRPDCQVLEQLWTTLSAPPQADPPADENGDPGPLNRR